MKTILYATDCTKNDVSALKYAYRFSCIMKTELHVIHAYDLPPVNLSVIQSSDHLKKRMQQEQLEIVAKFCKTHLKNEFRENPIKIHVVENSSVEQAILDTCKSLKPHLIVLGMKDEHSHRGFFSSNIANELLDKTDLPILMIPNGLIYQNISTIVYATDFEEEDIKPIKILSKILRPFNALIEVVHVYNTDTTTAKEKMLRFKSMLLEHVSYEEITFKTVASTKIKSGLISVIDNEKANILAMLERKHEIRLDNIFHKDLVKEMEAHVNIPILAFSKSKTKHRKPMLETM